MADDDGDFAGISPAMRARLERQERMRNARQREEAQLDQTAGPAEEPAASRTDGGLSPPELRRMRQEVFDRVVFALGRVRRPKSMYMPGVMDLLREEAEEITGHRTPFKRASPPQDAMVARDPELQALLREHRELTEQMLSVRLRGMD